MEISARNVFSGRVATCKAGPIAAEVQVDIGGGTTVTAVITAASAERLGLAAGSPVKVIVKASDVMIAID
ncbi:MAG: TOBE domain-containing protein [Rhodospirillales bacterium]